MVNLLEKRDLAKLHQLTEEDSFEWAISFGSSLWIHQGTERKRTGTLGKQLAPYEAASERSSIVLYWPGYSIILHRDWIELLLNLDFSWRPMLPLAISVHFRANLHSLVRTDTSLGKYGKLNIICDRLYSFKNWMSQNWKKNDRRTLQQKRISSQTEDT